MAKMIDVKIRACWRRYKKRGYIIMGAALVILLCGFSLTDFVLKSFDLDSFIKSDIILNEDFYSMRESLKESIDDGIDYARFKRELEIQLESDYYSDFELVYLEDSHILKFLKYIAEFFNPDE